MKQAMTSALFLLFAAAAGALAHAEEPFYGLDAQSEAAVACSKGCAQCCARMTINPIASQFSRANVMRVADGLEPGGRVVPLGGNEATASLETKKGRDIASETSHSESP